jgi:hypothetical protein
MADGYDPMDHLKGDRDSLEFRPVPVPNREDLRGIPLGSHLVIADEDMKVKGAVFTEEYRDLLLDGLPNEEDRYGAFVAVLEPLQAQETVVNMTVRKAIAPLVETPTEDPLKLISEAIQSGMLTPPLVMAMLNAVARDSRRKGAAHVS